MYLFGKPSGPSAFRGKRLVSYLLAAGLLTGWLRSNLSCQRDPPLIPRSTDRIARLEEWNVSEPLSNTAHVNPTDTLNWLLVEGVFYPIATATSSTYVYDNQQRLSRQLTQGYRNDTEFGRSQSNFSYTYTYSTVQVTVFKEGQRGSGLTAYAAPSTRQYLPLNEQGLVTSQPQFEARYGSEDSGYNGISQLFNTSLVERLKDTLRRYNSDGFLLETTNVLSPAWPQPWRFSQTIQAGNVVESRQAVVASPTTGEQSLLTRRLNYYDQTRANIPNPHSFLGMPSRNLLVKTVDKPATYLPTELTYNYNYDHKGRVQRYQIHWRVGTESKLYIVGRITYTE